jgi:hypothetical protein
MDGKLGALGRLNPMLLLKLLAPRELVLLILPLAADTESISVKGLVAVASSLSAGFFFVDKLAVMRENIVGLVGRSAFKPSCSQPGCDSSDVIGKTCCPIQLWQLLFVLSTLHTGGIMGLSRGCHFFALRVHVLCDLLSWDYGLYVAFSTDRKQGKTEFLVPGNQETTRPPGNSGKRKEITRKVPEFSRKHGIPLSAKLR